jgi:hypothetical protein
MQEDNYVAGASRSPGAEQEVFTSPVVSRAVTHFVHKVNVMSIKYLYIEKVKELEAHVSVTGQARPSGVLPSGEHFHFVPVEHI